MTHTPSLEFSRPVRIDQIPASGLRLHLSAKPDECAALARRFGLQAVDALSAQVMLKAVAGGAIIRLDGTLSAKVVQTCVVSLEPVPAEVEDSFSMTFGASEPEEDEIDLSLDEEDPPDPIVDGTIDAGEAVAEHLALALDPFPRKPGISFESADPEPEITEKRSNPFAVLAELRKNKG
ncbi:MAG TPA: DUF177 domain-containing protein [Magnetospirillum sp.]|jgi:uncharacterized metal-binding protein YceD (DUF177 family)|nr:DUF177 domain-containing protein [Magnetospirillum sp.]